MKRVLVLCALLVLIFTLSPPAGWGFEKAPAVADAAIDLAVPDSPGFTALGLGLNAIERPGSPREFALSILHGADANGNVQTGLSVDAAPFLWYGGRETTLREYQERYFSRFLNRTLLSFAVTHGDSTDDEGTRFALGLQVTPWDEGDPRMEEDFSTCLRDAVFGVEISIQRDAESILNEMNSLQKQKAIIVSVIDDEKRHPDRGKQEVLKEFINETDGKIQQLAKRREKLLTMNFADRNALSEDAITGCRTKKEYRARLWNRSGLSLGVVPTFTSATGTTDKLASSGTALWASLAFGYRDYGQLILHARYHGGENVPDPFRAGGFIEQDSFLAGGRIRLGGPDLNVNIEGVHVTEKSAGYRLNDKKIQYGAGLEYRIADDLWFVCTVGREAYDNKDDNIVVVANFRWAYTPAPVNKF